MDIPLSRLAARLGLAVLVIMFAALPASAISDTPDTTESSLRTMALNGLSSTFQCPENQTSSLWQQQQLWRLQERCPAQSGNEGTTLCQPQQSHSPARTADLESFLNFLGCTLEILGISWGGSTLVLSFYEMTASSSESLRLSFLGVATLTGGLLSPGCMTWLLTTVRNLATHY